MTTDAAERAVWVLGATGRSGRAITARLTEAGIPVVLVGRDSGRLAQAVERAGQDARSVVAQSWDATLDAVRRERPAVVVNTVGPFARTAVPIARACLPAGHYLDLGNDRVAAAGVLGLHAEAAAAGRTLVTGAGFGVLATESVVVELCRDQPTPTRVRVDALPASDLQAGVLGEALAATIVEGLPEGGGRYEGGRLVRARLGDDVARLVLPDGSAATTAGWPSGDLVAAHRVSGAPAVVAASTEVPTGPATRVLPVVAVLLRARLLRRLAIRQLARVRVGGHDRVREHSWGHARVEWADGTVREGWLQAGDASAFTAAAAATVASRLFRGQGRPGAHTPISALGPDLAAAAGGRLIVD